jgi:hypothetical protein
MSDRQAKYEIHVENTQLVGPWLSPPRVHSLPQHDRGAGLTNEVADDIRTRRAIENLPVLRGYTETRHQAKSWDRERRAVARIEATTLGLDIRFVVTSLDVGSAEWIYDSLYYARGQAENLIKLNKTQLASDRTSCRSALANQVRLVLYTAAYTKSQQL